MELQRIHLTSELPISLRAYMINLITPQYYEPNINKNIENYVKHCYASQVNKECRQKRFGALQQMPPTEKSFECLALDTVGGFN